MEATYRAAISVVRHNENESLPARSVHCFTQLSEAHVLRSAALLYRPYHVVH
jgi:hypothetical protein